MLTQILNFANLGTIYAFFFKIYEADIHQVDLKGKVTRILFLLMTIATSPTYTRVLDR